MVYAVYTRIFFTEKNNFSLFLLLKLFFHIIVNSS